MLTIGGTLEIHRGKLTRKGSDMGEWKNPTQFVETAPLGEAVKRAIQAGESLSDLCRRGGFLDKNGKADTSWLQRTVGLKPTYCSRRHGNYPRRFTRFSTAERIAKALDLDPVDIGL